MNYLHFYGLKEEPFSNVPDVRFYYNSSQHSRALVRLMYAAETMKGLALLLGDIGTGKTTLARRMFDVLPEEEYEASMFVVVHSDITPEWILKKIAIQLGVSNVDVNKITLLSTLTDKLFEIYDKKKKAVVLIDEAQMFKKKEVMEELRGLLNIESESQKLITFILFGLPELEENIMMDPPLAERVALKYTLEPFSEEATRAYIEHRLKLAGASAQLFDDDTYELIHRCSMGNPRRINTLCDNCLFEAFMLKLPRVSRRVVNMVAEDLGMKGSRAKRENINIENTEIEDLIEETLKEEKRE